MTGLFVPVHRALDYVRHPDLYWPPPDFSLLRYLRGAMAWAARVSREGSIRGDGDEKLTVILPSFMRIRNVQPMLWALLKATFVERIIVSNNNPRFRIRDWVTIRDERLDLVDQPRPTAAGVRFELARASRGRFFLSVDDDVFLTASQVRQLFHHLRREPQAPHGIKGELFLDRSGALNARSFGIEDQNSHVDVLNELYLFNRAHLDGTYLLARRLGISVPDIENGEDILLSLSGGLKPRIHRIGPVLKCPTAYRSGIATWASREHFFRERRDLFERANPLAGSLYEVTS